MNFNIQPTEVIFLSNCLLPVRLLARNNAVENLCHRNRFFLIFLVDLANLVYLVYSVTCHFFVPCWLQDVLLANAGCLQIDARIISSVSTAIQQQSITMQAVPYRRVNNPLMFSGAETSRLLSGCQTLQLSMTKHLYTFCC